MKKTKLRLDVKIVDEGLAKDLLEARALIMAGDVFVDEQRQDKPGTLIKNIQKVRIKSRSRFVSRGGDKLWGAVEDLGIAAYFEGATVLDCGASTGGFTDCSLQLKAAKVYALDVGFNQLDWKLRTDPRVVSMESTDIRALEHSLDAAITIVLADISFNSLDRTLKAMRTAVPGASVYFLLLVKPQFELEATIVPEAGVVNDPLLLEAALGKAKTAIEREGMELLAAVDSRVRGREGNQEIFVWARSLRIS
ncbi:MAG: TlyA family RNA methyltransferase [Chitinophagaceae bacterium]|nr:TlyA family RNA methyltransferase [Oligoflexus sp.]